MKAPELYSVTPEHFEIFKAECLRLLDLWGMTDVRTEFFHVEMKSPNTGASCGFSVLQHAVSLTLNTVWDTEPDEARLRYYARHEMIHTLLGPYTAIAESRHVTEDELVAAEHAVLNRLDRLLPTCKAPST